MQLMDPPGGRPWALLGIAGGSVLLNVVLLGYIFLGSADPASTMAAAEAPEPAVAAVAAVADLTAADALLAVEADADAEPEPTPEPILPSRPKGMHYVGADVERSMAYTFSRAVDEHADVVNAVYARLFFWDLDVRRDLQKGDRIEAVYTWDGDLAHIPVATYQSKKLGRTLRAYRFQASGDAFASYWNEAGVEVPRRLVNGPLRQYDQVTSLIKDRPSHKGMDFKTPVGTEVVSPKGAKVLRTNWNFKYNGNCVELRYDDGTTARFLHLSETTAKPGQRLAAGSRLGLSGNTGRSTAPHLHYELEKSGRVLDPVEYHGVEQRSLAQSDMAAFEVERDRLQGLL